MARKSLIARNNKRIKLNEKYAKKRAEMKKSGDYEGRVIVKDINIVTRHHKKTVQSQGGITKKESPIDISNVALIDPASKKPTRIKIKKEGGKKIRISCRSGKEI